MRILIAEDDSLSRTLLERTLQRAGQRILDLEDRLVEASESIELLLREVHRSRRERNCTAVMMCDIDHFSP